MDHEIWLLAFFEAKIIEISVLNTKLIVPNDYQQLWENFEWFLLLSDQFLM